MSGHEPSAAPDALGGSTDGRPLVPVWSVSVLLGLDAAALGVSAVLAVLLGSDLSLGSRGVLALVFFTFVPGWCVLRILSVPPSSLALLGAVGLSIATTMLAGELLVTVGGWNWRPASLAVCLLCVGALTMDLLRTTSSASSSSSSSPPPSGAASKRATDRLRELGGDPAGTTPAAHRLDEHDSPATAPEPALPARQLRLPRLPRTATSITDEREKRERT